MSPFFVSSPFDVFAENSSLFTSTVLVDSVMSNVARPVDPINLLRVSSVRLDGGLVCSKTRRIRTRGRCSSDNYSNDTVQRNVDGTHTLFLLKPQNPGL